MFKSFLHNTIQLKFTCLILTQPPKNKTKKDYMNHSSKHALTLVKTQRPVRCRYLHTNANNVNCATTEIHIKGSLTNDEQGINFLNTNCSS